MHTKRCDPPHGLAAGRHGFHLLGISRSGEAQHVSKSRAVRWVERGSLAAAVTSPLPGPLAHAALVEVIHQSICILPARFGTKLLDEELIRVYLDSRREELLRRLDRVQGACEIGLRIELQRRVAPPPAPVVPGAKPSSVSPAQYLAQRRAAYEQHDQLCDQADCTVQRYLRVLQGLYRDWCWLRAPSSESVRLSFLVAKPDVQALQNRLTTLASLQEGDRCTPLGPWPPYSFSEPQVEELIPVRRSARC